MNAIARDLFDWSAPPAVSMLRLDRNIDRINWCCENIATVCAGQGPHAAELRCANCGAHRGWLKREALEFLNTTATRFSAPAEPIILRKSSIGDHQMTEKSFNNSNRGALFRENDKEKETDRDYAGTINVDGKEYWMSGWVRTPKKGGQRFLSLSIKPKDAEPTAKEKPKKEDVPFDDLIPF